MVPVFAGCVIAALLTHPAISSDPEGVRPIAHAGLSRYAGQEPTVLNGTGSYDPDNSGTLSYTWRQISGPAVALTDTNTATPTISGFVQTHILESHPFGQNPEV